MRWPAVVIALACGCGDNIAGIELERWDAEELGARCAYLSRCGLFVDPAACDAYFRLDVDESRLAAVDAEQMRYDVVAAAQCLDEVSALTCDLSSREARVRPESCRRVFAGDLKGAEVCAFDGECESGACEREVCPAETCCYGRCTVDKQPSGIDGACAATADCIDDAWCGTDGLCHALVGVAGECQLEEQCEYGLGCIGATELMPGACRALPMLGEACPYRRCAEIGANCVAGTCVPIGLPGDGCELDVDCSPYGRCDTASKRCEQRPTLGMPCNSACAEDSWCDFEGTQACREPVSTTTPCTFDGQCASGYCAQGVFFRFCTDRAVCY
ncbi:MAG: hypothetical protein WKG01_26315 [Kofleriaceae bacterium]